MSVIGATPASARTQARQRLSAWRIAIYGTLVLLAAAAWLVTALRMSAMTSGPGAALGTFAFFILTWVVMMAAMMFPSVAPMVAMYVSIQRGRRQKAMPAPAGSTALFVAGYLLTWSLAGGFGYAIVRLAGRVDIADLSWDHGGHWLAAGVLLAAAAYEGTPWKQACLTRCRGPLSFILTSWRDGRRGALRMGALHGAWCLGCCWGLMAALFALGVMSLAWMTLVGALIAVEKLLPWRRTGVGLVACVLLALAFAVALAPDHVPGLSAPAAMTMR